MFLFWIPALIAEAAAVIPNGAKTFFAKEIATFINEPTNLFNNDPKNPPDWIILEIIHVGYRFQSFPVNIFKRILRLVPALFLTAFFSFFGWVSDNLSFTLLYSTIYINYRTFVVPLENSSFASLDFSRI